MKRDMMTIWRGVQGHPVDEGHRALIAEMPEGTKAVFQGMTQAEAATILPLGLPSTALAEALASLRAKNAGQQGAIR